jgi:hypothetical protein
MSPRRGGYSYTSGYDSSPWSEETQLSLDYSTSRYPNYRSLYIAGFAFDALTVLAFVAFLIWSCTIRNRGLPLKGLISTLFAYILYVSGSLLPSLLATNLMAGPSCAQSPMKHYSSPMPMSQSTTASS